MSNNNEVKKKTSIGGQALIEGIMMRGTDKTCMAVRHVSGDIKTEEWSNSASDRAKFWKAPFIRGVRNFIESMIMGYKCMMKSVEMSGVEDEDYFEKKKNLGNIKVSNDCGSKTPVANADSGVNVIEPSNDGETESGQAYDGVKNTSIAEVAKVIEVENSDEQSQQKEGFLDKYGTTLGVVIGGVLGVALSVGLFMLLPTFLFNLIAKAIPAINKTTIWRAVFEGVIRIVLFVAYVFAVSFMSDIKRVFMYHGAEHKTIFCYEKGLPLTVENIRAQSRFHPRCGTSFMIFMLLIGIVISMFITVTNPFLRTAIKLLTIPLSVGIGYEMIKLAGRSDNAVVKILSAPGLWLQRITTKEPDDGMIEVAINAMNSVIPDDPTKDIY